MDRRLLLLGLLRRQEMHGYQLNEFIEHNLAYCADIKKPTAYYLLEKLAEQGYIAEVDEAETPSNRPPRRTYRITLEGEHLFYTLLRENLRRDQGLVFPVDMAIAFIDALSSTEAHALLRERYEAVQQQLQAMRDVPQHSGPLQLVVEHHIAHLEAELAWLDKVIGWLADEAT